MKREDVLKLLLSYLSQFSFHPVLEHELLRLIAETGSESRFFKLLALRIRQLSLKGAQATALEEFEQLNSSIFSMHLTSQSFNIRILFSFLPNDKPVLLLAFYERAGKRRTDYTGRISEAEERLVFMKERFDYEQ